jgi:hypothetical protein
MHERESDIAVVFSWFMCQDEQLTSHLRSYIKHIGSGF